MPTAEIEKAKPLDKGVENLLVNCAGVQADQKLLIAHEDPALGWYDHEAPTAAKDAAEAMGVSVSMLQVGAPGAFRDAAIMDAVAAHDCTIFFARIGDQDRFEKSGDGAKGVMVYARDLPCISSPYGQTHHQAMVALKEAVNAVLFSGGEVEVTCPLGTRFRGVAPMHAPQESGDVAIQRFPLGVPMPMPASEFDGEVVLAHYLTPTGSKPYKPACCKIEQPVTATVESGRLADLSGDPEVVTTIRNHYERVASQFNIDRDCVHSWHAGIHPASHYDGLMDDDPDRWSNNVFTNPRFVHFHTCGAYAPGEICWMVFDPTISVGGVYLWESGVLKVENFEATAAAVANWTDLHALFPKSCGSTGLDVR